MSKEYQNRWDKPMDEPTEHPRADCEGCNKPDCPCNAECLPQGGDEQEPKVLDREPTTLALLDDAMELLETRVVQTMNPPAWLLSNSKSEDHVIYLDPVPPISGHVECPALPAIPLKPKRQGGDYRPHYPARQADAYMDHIEAELLSAQSRIGELEKERGNLSCVEVCLKYPNMGEYVAQVEAERDQLKSQLSLTEIRAAQLQARLDMVELERYGKGNGASGKVVSELQIYSSRGLKIGRNSHWKYGTQRRGRMVRRMAKGLTEEEMKEIFKGVRICFCLKCSHQPAYGYCDRCRCHNHCEPPIADPVAIADGLPVNTLERHVFKPVYVAYEAQPTGPCLICGGLWGAPVHQACPHRECDTHSVTEVNGAGVHTEYWLQCVACGEMFDPSEEVHG